MMPSQKRSPKSEHTERHGDEADMDDVDGQRSWSFNRVGRVPSPARGNPQSNQSEHGTIRLDDDPHRDMQNSATVSGNPNIEWILEWQTMSLPAAMAGQVDFLRSGPCFDGSNMIYVYFFMAFYSTITAATLPRSPIAADPIALSNLRSLEEYFAVFLRQCRVWLREDLQRIKTIDYSRCGAFEEFENLFNDHRILLSRTHILAPVTELFEEWEDAEHHLRAAQRWWKKQASIDNRSTRGPDTQPSATQFPFETLLSPQLLKMDYKFTEPVWDQWAKSCLAYFEYWTANPSWALPADDFIRHLSHYRLAMELFLKHKAVMDTKISNIRKVATVYMYQYRHYAGLKLESEYAKLREAVASDENIYLTEAAFWRLADNIEALVSEPPPGLSLDFWTDNVASMFRQDQVLKARNAIKLLYQEFQIKRYPEDEVSYLWWLTWRNLKYLLAVMTRSNAPYLDPDGVNDPSKPLRARDLAIPFIQQNLSRLLSIVEQDHEALHQKEIEQLVGDYCAYVDKYVKDGEGQGRVYQQFSSLSNTKPVPFDFLVSLEEALLDPSPKPSDGSQIISHRVVKRLNHLMEGPKAFERWVETTTGDVTVYSATGTSANEQAALEGKNGFNLDGANRPSGSPSSQKSSSLQAAGAGGGGGDDGEDDDGRSRACGDDEESSSGSSQETEEGDVSVGGTVRKMRSKQRKTRSAPLTPDTLTMGKIGWLLERTKQLRESSNPSPGSSRPDGDQQREDEAEEPTPELGLDPPNSFDYHRRRLAALRVEHRSAMSIAQYPMPETAASHRAASLQVSRDMADPGIISEGPNPEDVQPYVEPSLRLPPSESLQPAPPPASSPLRGALRSIREIFDRPTHRASQPRARSSPRSTPSIPESNAQRARAEREARGTTPAPLRRRSDRSSISKSQSSGGRRAVKSAHRAPSRRLNPGDDEVESRQSSEPRRSSEQSTEIAETVYAPWTASPSGDYNEGNRVPVAESSTESPSGGSNKENEAPSAQSSAYDSNKENRSPGDVLGARNRYNASSVPQDQGQAGDWDSPSPSVEYDNNIYLRSPIRSPITPTPLGSRASRLPPEPPGPVPSVEGGQSFRNVNVTTPDRPAPDDPVAEARRLNRWVDREMASGNRAMYDAASQFSHLVRNYDSSTLINLFELLRSRVELTVFNDYVFERKTTFGPNARPAVPVGVPGTVPAPSTPIAQISRFSQEWWNNPVERAREGQGRPGVAWANPPPEERDNLQADVGGRTSRRRGSSNVDRRPEGLGMKSASSSLPSYHDSDGNPNPDPINRGQVPQPSNGLHGAPSSAIHRRNRTLSWRRHPRTGLPVCDFNVRIGPEPHNNRESSSRWRPLLVPDPWDPTLPILNPELGPDTLDVIGHWTADVHGGFNIRVPHDWRVEFGTATTREMHRSANPDPPRAGIDAAPRLPSEQQISLRAPNATSDVPTGQSVREPSRAPPALGLVEAWLRGIKYINHEDLGGENGFKSPQIKPEPKSSSRSSSPWPPRPATTAPTPSPRVDSPRTRDIKVPSPSLPSSHGREQPPPPQTQPQPPPQTQAQPTPWYLSWQTSTVARLREELRRRGIPTTGLTRKQQLIDRLRQDDAESKNASVESISSATSSVHHRPGTRPHKEAGAGAQAEPNAESEVEEVPETVIVDDDEEVSEPGQQRGQREQNIPPTNRSASPPRQSKIQQPKTNNTHHQSTVNDEADQDRNQQRQATETKKRKRRGSKQVDPSTTTETSLDSDEDGEGIAGRVAKRRRRSMRAARRRNLE